MSKDPTHFPKFPFHCVSLHDYPISYDDQDHSSNEDVTEVPTTSPTISISPAHITPENSLSIPQLRRSQRLHKTPVYLSDYVHNVPSPTVSNSQPPQPHSLPLNALFTLKHHVSPDVFSSDSQSFVINISHDCEPNSYDEASIDPAWQKAMTQEFLALHDNNTWTLINLPKDKKPVGCR